VSASETPLPLATRLWFAWVCLFRVLFDPLFAARTFRVRNEAVLPASPHSASASTQADPVKAAPAQVEPEKPAKDEPTKAAPPSMEAALQLLALLQREGRLVDFLEQDIASFLDAEIGAAARVVHEGCRKALRAHVKVTPVRAEDEGASVTLAAGYSPSEVKLSGAVQGSPPYRGVLRHRGWRASDLSLPTSVKGHDASVIAPAEVEL
jgi:Domain of unknown function (DUF2760)